LASCKTINFSSRKEKDITLSENNNALNNTFRNNIIDSIPYTPSSIWQQLSNKNYKPEYLLNTKVKLELVDKTHIKAQLLSDDKILQEKILKGKFKKGYFALKNRLKAEFTAGPLLWAFAGFKIYLGITNQHNLILFETNAGSTVVIIFPIFGAASTNETEYKSL
jgi:hypothetical protein